MEINRALGMFGFRRVKKTVHLTTLIEYRLIKNRISPLLLINPCSNQLKSKKKEY